jgi:hypothetical protein
MLDAAVVPAAIWGECMVTGAAMFIVPIAPLGTFMPATIDPEAVEVIKAN